MHTPARVDLQEAPMGMFKVLKLAQENLLKIIPRQSLEAPIVSGHTGTPWHMITEPDAIRRVLLENLDNYPKSDITKTLLKPAIGDSLFIAEGAHWRWQRRAAAPVFSHRNVVNLAPIMSAAAERSAARITAAGPRAIDMAEDMVRTTFDVTSDVTFSGDAGMDAAAIHRAIDMFIEQAGKLSLFDVMGLPDWVPRPARMFAGAGVGHMKEMADEAVEARRTRGPKNTPDLLDLLLAGEDPETHRQMTTGELRDNLLAFIVAGHETTALTLAWSFYLCAFDQNVQDKARAEAQSVLQGRVATGDDITQLPYIRMIADEALRLYPPAAIVSRTARGPDVLCGTAIHPGDTVTIPIYALHRSARLWEDPDAFRPERFADRKSIERYAYLPFGDGPRICIGASFALQEAVIVLATLLSRFRFTPVRGKTPDPVMFITLRPQGGVWLEAEPL